MSRERVVRIFYKVTLVYISHTHTYESSSLFGQSPYGETSVPFKNNLRIGLHGRHFCLIGVPPRIPIIVGKFDIPCALYSIEVDAACGMRQRGKH